jgi:hypothetical protein
LHRAREVFPLNDDHHKLGFPGPQDNRVFGLDEDQGLITTRLCPSIAFVPFPAVGSVRHNAVEIGRTQRPVRVTHLVVLPARRGRPYSASSSWHGLGETAPLWVLNHRHRSYGAIDPLGLSFKYNATASALLRRVRLHRHVEQTHRAIFRPGGPRQSGRRPTDAVSIRWAAALVRQFTRPAIRSWAGLTSRYCRWWVQPAGRCLCWPDSRSAATAWRERRRRACCWGDLLPQAGRT